MESLSRPFHTRKLSNASGLSGKNAYDGFLSGHRPKYGGAPADKVEDYREIFGSAQAASSIPVLDLSALEESSDGWSLEEGSTKPDYGKIFGGFRDEDIAVSYEDLFARDKARAPLSTSPSSQDLADLSHQSFDASKQFSMSYHKINQRSKDGTDGTTHVAQLHAVPGFTCFIDETASQPKREAEKQKSSVTINVHPGVKSSKGDFPEKQTSRSAVESRSKFRQNESLSDDRISKTVEANLESHPSKVSSSGAASATNIDKPKDYQKRSTATNTGTSKSDTPAEFSPTYFDEELDVNSAAAASVAALRKAIEKAQESIRIAKESVGRKKEGLRSFSSKSFKDSLKVKTRVENVSAVEEQKEEDNKMKEIFERVGTSHKHGGTVVFPDFADGEKLFGAKKVIDEIHGKFSESAKNSEIPISYSLELRDSKIICNSKVVVGQKEAIGLDSAGKHEYATASSEAVENSTYEAIGLDSTGKHEYATASSGAVDDSTYEAIGLDSAGKYEYATGASEAVENNTYEAPQEDYQRPYGFLVFKSFEKKLGDTQDTIEDDKPRESKENKDEVRPSNSHKLAEGSNNLTVYPKVEDEKKISEGSDENDYENEFNEVLGLLENKKQEVLEQEQEEKVESAERHDPNSYDEASKKGLEDEKELKEDGDTECHKVEDTGEKFYDVCELEMIENAQTFDNLGKSKVSPKEDCKMEEKENHKEEVRWKRLDEVHEPDSYENSSSDYDDAEESESVHGCHDASDIVIDKQESCKVGLDDNNVESSQEIDDAISSSEQVIGASYEFRVEDTEAVAAENRSEEKEIFEKISVDHTASEGKEDEYEAKADNLSSCGLADVDFGQNDVQSESSSGTVGGMEIEVNEYKERKETIEEATIVFVEEEESNLQQSHEETVKTRIKEETGVSQEPKVSNKMEETMGVNEEIITSHHREKKEETGPSKVVEKEHLKRIEEVTTGAKDRERNRLAVERAIREARERAFAEARERAERAAVERATAEVRQRVMADAREKVAKASVGTKPSDKASAQSKLRAERAAVERATAEARQRALEKAMSQKNISVTSAQANEIRRTSFDLHSSNGTSAESAQRSKAKLEKHYRIMERAAKALAEKEKRDLLAQKEQAERSRLAENLDADIKRWSSGKEGNLRALLSTLQYILGADSGWQPVSLTEIITSSAVKKAYRKATLCVHPDKLQQRGASIQQKYICEKVFDLLKAAWNRFNSGER